MPKAKAKKQQITAAHKSGMRDPRHRIRYDVALLKDRPITNPKHKRIVDHAKKLLKKEEIQGGAWYNSWDDFVDLGKDILSFPSQLLNEVPYVKEAIEFAFPEAAPILAIAPTVTKFVYGDKTNVWLTDMLSDMPVVGDIRADTDYKSSNDLGQENWFSGKKSDQQIADAETKAEQIANYEENKRRDTERRADESIYGEDKRVEDLANAIRQIEQVTPQQSETPYEPYAVPLYDAMSHGVDSALRFPIVYNYENTDQPQNLRDYLITSGVSGRNFSRNEFGNTVLNQRPFAFLDFPLNGGSIRKINYRKTCA